MSRVLITGAAGFVGRHLLGRLLSEGLDGSPVSEIVALDRASDDLPDDPRLRRLTGSIVDPSVLDRALSEPVQTIFHLASVPGGAAEKDPDLGQSVNLQATMDLLTRLRQQGDMPRLVFASTVAVYGDPLPAVVDEQTPALPALSYGAHKLASEILIADAARRGWVQACSLRLPGVVARPGESTGLVSAFMSELFWRLRAGQPVVLPVSPEGTAWWISVDACVDNILHAVRVDSEATGPRRVVQMPALHLRMDEVVQALADLHGSDQLELASYAPQQAVQRLFASYPPLHTPIAESLGFRHDGDVATLVRRATQQA